MKKFQHVTDVKEVMILHSYVVLLFQAAPDKVIGWEQLKIVLKAVPWCMAAVHIAIVCFGRQLFEFSCFLGTGLAEIDSLELKYDTRNVGDLAAFSKAWSQTSLLEKLLLKPNEDSSISTSTGTSENEFAQQPKAEGRYGVIWQLGITYISQLFLKFGYLAFLTHLWCMYVCLL